MNIAVDACIVISAMKVPSLAIVDDGMPWRCRQVVLEADPPRIIAPAWFEVCRFSEVRVILDAVSTERGQIVLGCGQRPLRRLRSRVLSGASHQGQP